MVKVEAITERKMYVIPEEAILRCDFPTTKKCAEDDAAMQIIKIGMIPLKFSWRGNDYGDTELWVEFGKRTS